MYSLHFVNRNVQYFNAKFFDNRKSGNQYLIFCIVVSARDDAFTKTKLSPSKFRFVFFVTNIVYRLISKIFLILIIISLINNSFIFISEKLPITIRVVGTGRTCSLLWAGEYGIICIAFFT